MQTVELNPMLYRTANVAVFEKVAFWLLWTSVWFSPLKLDIGLNLAFEFMLAYSLFLYYFLSRRVSYLQLIGILALLAISILDFLRTDDYRSFMFVGFVMVQVGFVELARSNFKFSRKKLLLLLAFPVVAVLLRVLFPDTGGITGYDETVVGGEVVQRFNLLGYESNSLSAMMVMLFAAILSGLGNLSLLIRLAYSLFCISVILVTFSRTGIYSLVVVVGVLAYFNRGTRFAALGITLVTALLATQVTQFESIIQRTSERALAFDLFQDGRGSILIERLNKLAENDVRVFLGRGFMHFGASDNTFLSIVYGYGFVGSLIVLVLVSLAIGFPHKMRFNSIPIVGVLVGMFFSLLTADTFGQAKNIGCFYSLIVMLLASNHSTSKQMYGRR
jgi:hypothetical protein